MKTTRNTSKRLLAVALVLLMALGLALPVLAEPDDSTIITIVPNDYTTTPTGELAGDSDVEGRFNAYQIFAGGLDNYTGGVDETDPSTGYNNPNANWLTNVEWGSGISGDKIADLLLALMAEGTKLSDLNALANIKDDPRYVSAYASTVLDAVAVEAAKVEGKAEEDDTLNDLVYYEWSSTENKYVLNQTTYNEAINTAWTTNSASVTLGKAFEAALAFADYKNITKDSDALVDGKQPLKDTASVIARVLSDLNGSGNNNAALTEAFAKVVAAKKADGSYEYLSTTKTVSSWANTAWTIDIGTNDGYYLIVDTYPEKDTNKVNSDYLVGVFGDTTIKVKANGSDWEKNIGTDRKNTSSYEQGQYIPFTLAGTVAPNYVNYNEYFFAFRDEMSAGLTLDPDTIKAYLTVKNPLYGTVDGEKETLKIEITDLILTSDFTYDGSFEKRGESTTNQAKGYRFITGNTKLDIVFPNLKKLDFSSLVDAKYVEAGLKISGGDTITIKYEAYLNEGAEIDEANTNKFHLEFSNNPNSTSYDKEGTTKTPDDVVYVYDFGVSLDKYDASTDTKDPLAEAGFSLSKTETLYQITDGTNTVWVTASDLQDYFNGAITVTTEKALSELGEKYADGRYSDYKFTGETKANTVLYAILKKNADEATYDIVGWIAEADLKEVLGALTVANNWKVSKKGKEIANVAISATDLDVESDEAIYYFAGETTATGDLNFQGLAEGVTYTIAEVYAPTGYDKITTPITVKFVNVEYFEEGDDIPDGLAVDMLKTLDAEVTGPDITEKETQHIVVDGKAVSTDGYAAVIAVANMPNGWLPGTGGIGTYVFYVVGGLLLAGAALYLVLSAVKKNKAQEQ